MKWCPQTQWKTPAPPPPPAGGWDGAGAAGPAAGAQWRAGRLPPPDPHPGGAGPIRVPSISNFTIQIIMY